MKESSCPHLLVSWGTLLQLQAGDYAALSRKYISARRVRLKAHIPRVSRRLAARSDRNDRMADGNGIEMAARLSSRQQASTTP